MRVEPGEEGAVKSGNILMEDLAISDNFIAAKANDLDLVLTGQGSGNVVLDSPTNFKAIRLENNEIMSGLNNDIHLGENVELNNLAIVGDLMLDSNTLSNYLYNGNIHINPHRQGCVQSKKRLIVDGKLTMVESKL